MNHLYLGKFITLEGIEGVGKSTQLKYIQNYLIERGLSVITTREPGGGVIAEKIRGIFLEKLPEEIIPDTELLLLFAGRAQHLSTVILPALKEGKWVVCDRFTDASYAYQGGGRHIPQARIAALETWVHGNFQPDLTLLFDAPVDIALSRIHPRGPRDRIESENKAFFTRVRECYLERAKQYDRYRIIDASLDCEAVQRQLKDVIDEYFRNYI